MCQTDVLGLPHWEVLHLWDILFLSKTIGSEMFSFVEFWFWFFFFLSQQFCLEKCHFDEAEIAEEILPILTILLGRELGRNILKVLELPVMTFSEWKGVLIYFFFSSQNDVSKRYCFVEEQNGWIKGLGKKKREIKNLRQFLSILFCNSVGFSDNMGWFKIVGCSVLISRLTDVFLSWANDVWTVLGFVVINYLVS